MQSLYTFFTNKEENIIAAENKMLKNIESVLDLNLIIISLLVELVRYADNFFEESKKKHFPTDDDLNPNRRFTTNKVVKTLFNNEGLLTNTVSDIWLKNDHDVLNKIFRDIYQSDLYSTYILNTNIDIEIDQRFFVNILNEHILNNELVNHILEERSIYWIDDLPFVATIIMGNIKIGGDINIKKVFKDNSDKDFALQLFRNTIKNNQEYESIITKFAKNWDLERIAIMDQLFLKMAFTEVLTIKDMPVKVSMNEYIEISKYYSTAKSRLFINGILDNAVRCFRAEDRIKKNGRGLA